MSLYFVNCACENMFRGTYQTLEEAQAFAQGLLDEYLATDPDNLSGQNTPTTYVAVRTKTSTRESGGIVLTSSSQRIERIWKIETLTPSE